MNTTTIIILIFIGIALISTLNVMCFFIGAKVGQKIVNNEKIELPSIPNPVRAYQEYKEEQAIKEEVKEKTEAYKTALREINDFDGF